MTYHIPRPDMVFHLTLFLVCLLYLLHLLLNPLRFYSEGGSPQITDHAESLSTDHNIVGSETLNEHSSVVIHRDLWDSKIYLH